MLGQLRLRAYKLVAAHSPTRSSAPSSTVAEPPVTHGRPPGHVPPSPGAKLPHAEPHWRGVFESCAIGLALTDVQGHFLDANPALQAMLGWTAEALGSMTLADVMRPAEQQALHSPLAALASGRSQRERVQGRCRRQDGSWFWADISLSLLSGTPRTLVCTVEDVTERRRSQDESRELASLVENSTDFICIAALAGQMRFVNAAGRRMMGLRADAPAHTTSLLDYIAAQDHAQYRGEILPALLVTGLWEGETRFRHFRTGTLIPMWHHAFLIRDPGSEHPVAMGMISRNLCECRCTQAELLALKNDLATELEAMKRLHELGTRLLAIDGLEPLLEEILNCMMALQDADFGCVQFYNADSDALEMVTHRNFPPEIATRFAVVRDGSTPCGMAMRRRERVIIEDMRTDPDFAANRDIVELVGMRSALSTPLFARNGELLGMITTHLRRTHRPSEHELRLADLCARQAAQLIERKRVETALRRSEACLAAGESLGHTGSWAWNLARRDLYWSHEHFALFGLDPATYKPTLEGCMELVHPDDLNVINDYKQVMMEHKAAQVEFRIVRPDGEVRHMLGLSHPILDDSGKLTDYVGTVTDITDRKRSEEALAQAHEELAQLTRVMSMGELAASVAHEINQPLAAIVTNGQACLRWLTRDTPNLDEARAAAERTVRDGIRAGAVIQRIRALSTRTASHAAWLDLNEVIQQALQLGHTELQRHDPTLRVELASNLPQVHGDRIQLQQVVLNLLRNGMEAMQGVEGRPRELLVRSRVATGEQAPESGAEHVVVDVSDSGIGLNPGTADRLFDAFFTTKSEGMGLGLAISRRILEAHGGRLWVAPNSTHGVTVSFSVPTGVSEQ
jgi:PAS domain S-box-containing protein